MKFVSTYDDYGRPLLPDIRTKHYIIHTHNIVSWTIFAIITVLALYCAFIGLCWTIWGNC